MANYKTTDFEIISPVTKGLVKPMRVQVAKHDTSVKALLATNIYQGAEKSYSGDIMDYSYTSSQDIKAQLDQTKELVSDLKEKLPKKGKQSDDDK